MEKEDLLNSLDNIIDDDFLEEYKSQLLSKNKSTNSDLTGNLTGNFTSNLTDNLIELKDRKVLLEKITSERCIVLFSKKSFPRCALMKKKLIEVCKLRTDIAFYTVEAESVADVCAYMNISVLPFLAFFKDGRAVDGIVGFEGLGTEDFTVHDLLTRIQHSEI